MKNSAILLIVTSLVWLSCGSAAEEARFELPANAAELLAGKESKTWKLARRTNGKMRVNMGDCTLAYRQTFTRTHTVTDNNKERSDCGPSIDGSWQFSFDEQKRPYLAITSDIIPALFKVKSGSTTKHFRLVALSDSMIVYRFAHELFTSKTTIIEDVLVPESAEYDGRNFHW